ncbi:MAG: amidohydrolase family protein [Betaproteobacteria bacterium]|nr:amidohydrolase family protein [Betaproteobacteria bacterium]
MSGAGFVNAHTHLYSGLAPFGMPAPSETPAEFVQILERVWWKLDRALDAASLRISAQWSVAEALRLGTVGLIDHHESPNLIEGSLDVLADVCEAAGMPAVLCYGATERNGGRDEGRRGLAECRRFIESNTRSLVRGVVGLHASFTVSDETVREAAALCRELDTVVHVHVAEDRADVADAVRRGWAGPLERLDRLGALPPGSILAHGVHLNASQVRRAAQLGCWLVQNPRSNRGNRVGYPAALGASTRVALGTDGYPSDLEAELAVLLEEVPRHGDDAQAAGRRPQAGHALLAERFGGTVPSIRVPQDINLNAIRAEAAAAAPRLWSRMAEL